MAIEKLNKEFKSEEVLLAEDLNSMVNKTNELVEDANKVKVGKVDETPDASAHGEVFNNYDRNRATGSNSHAEGDSTRASGDFSHAEGSVTGAYGKASHAEGFYNLAEEEYSHAEGKDTGAYGTASHSEGMETKARSAYSHSEGLRTMANSVASHAEGNQTSAGEVINKIRYVYINYTGEFDGYVYSQSLSCWTDAAHGVARYRFYRKSDDTDAEITDTSFGDFARNKENYYAVSVYSGTPDLSDKREISKVELVSSGSYSHSEGSYTKAKGENSHAEGYYSASYGNNSHAEGSSSAYGDGSHSQNIGTVADNYAQTSIGTYNTREENPTPQELSPEQTIFSVGNGTSDRDRSDALKMLGNGTTWLNGIGGFTGKNPTKENSLQSVINTAGKKIDEISNKVDNIIGYYGVEKVKSSSDPIFLSVIGREDLQKSHPILHDFAISKVKDGKVVAHLNEVDWNKLSDGNLSNVVYNSSSDDDDTDILDCNEKGFYAILGDQSTEYEIWAFGYKPFTHRGVKAMYIPPFGDCPDYSVIKEGIQRSIRDNTLAGSNGAGTFGISAYNENGYPSTSVGRFQFESYARKKNTPNHVDNKENTPYANAFQLDRRVWAGLLFVKFKTKDLHALSLLGGGISANDGGGTSEETWLQKSGFRTRKSAEEAWTYQSIDWGRWTNTNKNKPLLKMFDCQLALSHAYENNIAEKQQFEFDGATWQYINVVGSKGIYDGEMTAIVTKVVKSDDGNTELCLVQPIVCGRIVGWGNIYKWVSGIECICHDKATSTYDIYQTDDVNLLTTDTDALDHNLDAPYPFESTYAALEKGKANKEGFMLETYNNSLMGDKFGGNLHTGSCLYAWYTSTCGDGKKGRRGVRFGIYAHYSYCALRSAIANADPSISNSNIGGGFRVALNHKP